MSEWVLITIVVIGSLFALKMVYALSIVIALPFTQGALFVSTSRVKMKAVFDALNLRAGQVLVDLGCGDGRVLRSVSAKYGVNAVGYEINPLAYCLARVRCSFSRGIDIRYRSFWTADLSAVDVIFCYLYPDVMSKLAQKLRQELKPGATVISCNFPIPGWFPVNVLRSDLTRHNDPIYIYKPEAVGVLNGIECL
jgi:SAM-dependent methyltransferase